MTIKRNYSQHQDSSTMDICNDEMIFKRSNNNNYINVDKISTQPCADFIEITDICMYYDDDNDDISECHYGRNDASIQLEILANCISVTYYDAVYLDGFYEEA